MGQIAHICSASYTIAIEGLSAVRRRQKNGTEFVLAVETFVGSAGDRIGLVGRSGSGKSTVLEALGLLLWLDQLKEFRMCGTELTRLFVRKDLNALARFRAENIGFVPQDSGLLPYLSVEENARIAATLAGREQMPRPELQQLADEIGIAHLLDRLPAKLSGGEKQRASVLRAVVTRPKIILADEPTAALDHETSVEVMECLTRLAAHAGATLICASHQVELLRAFAFDIHRIHRVDEDGRHVAILRREDL